MIPPKIIPVLVIFLILHAFPLVYGQFNTSSPVVSPSSESFLQKLCLNVDEYKSMFKSILHYSNASSRNTIAVTITWVDWFYNSYNRYEWILDPVIGALTTLFVFLLGGSMIPIVAKLTVKLAMSLNMRLLIKQSMYEAWTRIPPSDSDQYDVAMQNSIVIVRQIAPTAYNLQESSGNVDWIAIMGSLSQLLSDLKQGAAAHKPF